MLTKHWAFLRRACDLPSYRRIVFYFRHDNYSRAERQKRHLIRKLLILTRQLISHRCGVCKKRAYMLIFNFMLKVCRGATQARSKSTKKRNKKEQVCLTISARFCGLHRCWEECDTGMHIAGQNEKYCISQGIHDVHCREIALDKYGGIFECDSSLSCSWKQRQQCRKHSHRQTSTPTATSQRQVHVVYQESRSISMRRVLVIVVRLMDEENEIAQIFQERRLMSVVVKAFA